MAWSGLGAEGDATSDVSNVQSRAWQRAENDLPSVSVRAMVVGLSHAAIPPITIFAIVMAAPNWALCHLHRHIDPGYQSPEGTKSNKICVLVSGGVQTVHLTEPTLACQKAMDWLRTGLGQMMGEASANVKGSGAPTSQPPPDKGVAWRVLGGLKTMRPHQWVKNVFVLAPLVFAKDFFREDLFIRAFGAFAVFCLLASAVYTINDLVDVESDRAHPIKRFRPIASGRFPPSAARVLAVALVVVSLAGASLGPLGFVGTAIGYFVLNLAYTFKLKKIAYIDVSCIAAGFVLRVVGGGFAVGVHVSWYLLVCTALLALFLGFGKRRHELAQTARKSGNKTRTALEAYTPRALTIALAITATATVATYIAYTLDPATKSFFKSDWLWLTTPFTVFGVVRFLQLMAGRPKAESPTQEMLRDTMFVLNLVVWAIVIFAIVYRLRPEVGP